MINDDNLASELRLFLPCCVYNPVSQNGHTGYVSHRLSSRHAFHVHEDVTRLSAGSFASGAEAAGLQKAFTHLICPCVSKPRARRSDRTRGRGRMGGDSAQRSGGGGVFAKAAAFKNILEGFFELLAEAGVDNGV